MITDKDQGSPSGGFRKGFNEGTLHKQVVTFQSGRGKFFNDQVILKKSINQVQRRSLDR